ncbi:hypothetical protein DICPUDRAFT_57630 [Dictyostelium purpureum]|uniref:Major facilitator superfamily (MFS) profile domain-containing protein n=1 Tax=Dictyostelium purpureum TaxID=5786 RepID=F0ZWT5_DICPU|nr:uncharacterized protein DICPUDRAFT_57630 [Dictyostelium purpureum]EGC31595.1 hypothetical protein DICPUDRAFT_57630 [Dictyostelium purpureum]|eukprot:XP_003291879.1 hypothetical protein DICPUDRAFT_57630 [Dictyostelium purpureum]
MSSVKYININETNEGAMDEVRKKQENRSINMMVLTVFLQSIGFTLTMPSMYDYLYNDDPNHNTYFSFIVASYSLGQFIGSPIFGKWSNRRNSGEPLIASIAISVIGSILYAVTYEFKTMGFVGVMVAARFIVGFGAGNVSVCRAYASEMATLENKTIVMSKMSGAQGVGFVLGPIIGTVLNFINFHIKGLVVNGYTAPGYLQVLIAVINILVVVFLFKDCRDLKKRNAPKQEESRGLLDDEQGLDNQKPNQEQAIFPIILSIYLFAVVISIFAVFETILTIMTKQYYGWEKIPNGLILGGSGILSIVVFIIISRPFIKKIEDRKTAIFGFINLFVALIILTNYNHPLGKETILPKVQLFIGTFFVSVGYPIASSLVYAIFSKILNPNSPTVGTKMGWLTAGGSLARMVGPIWAEAIWDSTGSQGMVLFLATAGLTLTAVILLLVFYKTLAPHPEYKKQMLLSNAIDNVDNK